MTDKPTSLSVGMAKRIEMWPVERLVPYEKNARTHSPEQIGQIAASISEFGFVNPVLVDSNDGVIAGHGRLAAAKELGMAEVPVVILDHLTDRQRRAYILADNKLALNAGWDLDVLKDELVDLEEMDFDLGLLGWGENELTYLKEGLGEWESDISDVDNVDESDETAPAVIKVKCSQQDKDDVRDWLKRALEEETGFENVTVE